MKRTHISLLIVFSLCFLLGLSNCNNIVTQTNNVSEHSNQIKAAEQLLEALYKNDTFLFSEIAGGESFVISRRFTFGNYQEARGEDVYKEKINLSVIQNLDFQIGKNEQPSDLYRRFNIGNFEEENPIMVVDIFVDFDWSNGATDILLDTCNNIQNELGEEYVGYAIFPINHNSDFIFTCFYGSGVAFSDWAYFEKQATDSYELKYILIVY